MIENKFLVHWIAKAFLDVIVSTGTNIADHMSEQAEYMIACATAEDFQGFTIDSTSVALDVVLSVARCVFNDDSIVGVPDLVVMTGVEDTFEITEEIITQMLVFAVSSFDCPHRESFVRNILQMDQDAQEYLMCTIQSTLQQQSGISEDVDVGEAEEIEEVTEQDDEAMTSPSEEHTISHSEDSTEAMDEDPIVTEPASTSHHNYRSNISDESFTAACSSCQYFEQLVEKLKAEKMQERKTLEIEINDLKNGIATETSRLVDAELVLQEKDRVLKELEGKVADHEQLQGKLEDLTRQIADKLALISTLQDQIDVDRTKLEKFDTMDKNLTKMKEKLADLKEIQQQLKTETEAHSQTYQSLIAAEQTVQELRPFQSQVEEYRLELAEKAIALTDAQCRLTEAEQQIVRLQSSIAAMEAGKQVMLTSQSHLAEELHATAEELRARERFNGLGEGMSEFNPVLMQELSKLRAENADLWSKLDRTSLDAVEKLQREVADQKAIAKSLTEKWQVTKTNLEHTARDLDQTRRQLLDLTLLHQQLQRTKDEHDAMFAEDVQQLQDAKCQLFASLTQTQAQLRDTSEQLEVMTGKRKREQSEHEVQIATMQAQHQSEVDRLQDEHEEAMATLEDEHRAALAEAEQRYVILQADLEQEVVKRRKVERLKKLYETESQRQRLQLQHMSAAQETSGSGNAYVQGDFDVAAKEIRSLQEKLDDAHRELHQLKTQFASNSAAAVVTAMKTQQQQQQQQDAASQKENQSAAVSNSASSASSTTSSLRKPPLRVLNPTSVAGVAGGSGSGSAKLTGGNGVGGALLAGGSASGSSTGNKGSSSSNSAMMNYAEQAELHDKQLEQLAREKRELLTKSLEENKEKMELSQRLLALDKENAQLKADLRKRTLEKERLERNLIKTGKLSMSEVEAEH